MRVRIIFILQNKGSYVPFHHQFLLAQLKESILEGGNGRFRDFTEFTFSGLKGQTKVGKNGLHFYSSRVTVVVSSPNPEFIEFLVHEVSAMREMRVGTMQLLLESVEQEMIPPFGDSLKCVCISPVVLVDPTSSDFYAKKFISPDTDIFSDLLYESTMTRMEKSGYFTPEQITSFYKFQIVPDKEYLRRIREEEKKFARIYPLFEGEEKLEVRGYTFPFVLYAAPEVQQFVFESGLGAYTNKGFGMLDFADSSHVRKTEVYLSATANQMNQP